MNVIAVRLNVNESEFHDGILRQLMVCKLKKRAIGEYFNYMDFFGTRYYLIIKHSNKQQILHQRNNIRVFMISKKKTWYSHEETTQPLKSNRDTRKCKQNHVAHNFFFPELLSFVLNCSVSGEMFVVNRSKYKTVCTWLFFSFPAAAACSFVWWYLVKRIQDITWLEDSHKVSKKSLNFLQMFLLQL